MPFIDADFVIIRLARGLCYIWVVLYVQYRYLFVMIEDRKCRQEGHN